jgi:hypothetical protein
VQEYSISPEISPQAPSCLLVLLQTPPILHQIQEEKPYHENTLRQAQGKLTGESTKEEWG